MIGFVMKVGINKDSCEALLTSQNRHWPDALLLFVHFSLKIWYSLLRGRNDERLTD